MGLTTMKAHILSPKKLDASKPLLTVDDIFSCIGGHSIGLHRAGMTTVRFCEKDRWRREQIASAFPNTRMDEDVRTAGPIEADVLVGGPPCQRTAGIAAVHGKRTGETLWPSMFDLVRRGRYRWVVVEQPESAGKAWLATVKGDLEAAGYHVRGAVFAASDVGAPHTRRRMYAIAHADLPRLEVSWRSIPSAIECVKGRAAQRGDWSTPDGEILSLDNGLAPADRRRWIEALGDSNPPQMMEVIGVAINGNA